MTENRSYVDGTVSHVGRDDVLIDLGPDFPSTVIRVSVHDLPPDLRRYGQPVRVSRSADGGLKYSGRPRRPVVPLPGEEEVDDWIASLE